MRWSGSEIDWWKCIANSQSFKGQSRNLTLNSAKFSWKCRKTKENTCTLTLDRQLQIAIFCFQSHTNRFPLDLDGVAWLRLGRVLLLSAEQCGQRRNRLQNRSRFLCWDRRHLRSWCFEFHSPSKCGCVPVQQHPLHNATGNHQIFPWTPWEDWKHG